MSTGHQVRLGAALIGILLLLGVLSGCSSAPMPASAGRSEPSGISPAERTAAAQTTIDDFVAAARRGDQAGAAALVSARDDGFARRTAIWAANLARLDWSSLTWTVQSAQGTLQGARQQAVGVDAWVQEVTISWAYPGETRIAQESVWLTFVNESQPAADDGVVAKLAGDTDDPTGSSPTQSAPAPARIDTAEPGRCWC